MATPDYSTPVRLGAANSDTGTYAKDNLNFIKVFSGEVLTAFEQAAVMLGRVRVRNITSGKSASFPLTGYVSAAYHTPGVGLDPANVNSAEKVINVDDLLTASVFIPNIDEAKNHYEVRSIWSTECANALARAMDYRLICTGIQAARDVATSAGGPGETVVTSGITNLGNAGALTIGSQIVDAAADDTVANLTTAIINAAKTLDTKNVPPENRHAVMGPDRFYLFLNTSSAIMNRDYGGSGSLASAQLPPICGINLLKSNVYPTANASEVTGDRNTYHADYRPSMALVWHPSAMGTVKLLDLAVEMDYETRNQGTLIVAKYAVGHGVLQAQAAVEIVNAAVS